MQSQTSDNSGFHKLKAILFLGLTCNYTTLLGCIVVFVLLQHLRIETDFFSAIIFTVCFAPFFMGDAVNSYVLGRIKLEAENDWDDIRMTPQSKERIAKYFKLYRGISIVSSYGIVAWIISSIAKLQIPEWFSIAVIILPITHFILCFMNILTGIAPVIPSYKKFGIIHRVLFFIIFGGLLYKAYQLQDFSETKYVFILAGGAVYFAANGIMSPLPSNGSLLKSILIDSFMKQTQSAVTDPSIGYTNKPVDIEDASIVGNNIENVSRETHNISTEETNNSVFPDAIIDTPQETPDEQ